MKLRHEVVTGANSLYRARTSTDKKMTDTLQTIMLLFLMFLNILKQTLDAID